MIRVNNRLAFAAEPSVTLGEPTGELTLKIQHGKNCSREVRVTSSKCSIGSAAGCTIELCEPGVQPVHCVILRGAGKTVVRRWAPNAWLNGQHFVDAELNSGDELRIAGVTIQVFFASETFFAGRPQSTPRGASRATDTREFDDAATLSTLVMRLQEAESRVQQLQAAVAQHRNDAATIVRQIKRVERLIRSDSARKFQKVLDGLHQEKKELEQRLAALELQHQEQRSAWQLELDCVAAELARQTERNKLEEQKCRTQAERIAELESNATPTQADQAADQTRRLAKAKKQLGRHRAALNSIRAEMDEQQERHLAQSKAFEESLSRTQTDLQEARDQLQSKQEEVLSQQQAQEELRTAYAERISHLEAALQQNVEQHDRLSVQLEVQRAAEQEAMRDRDQQITNLEKELRQRDHKCAQLADQLEQARQAARQSGELERQLAQLETDLQRSVDEKAALQGELDRLRVEELPGLQQQISQLTEELQATRDESSQLQAEMAAAEQRSSDAELAHQDEITALVEQLNQSRATARELEASLESLDVERAQLTQQIVQLEQGNLQQLQTDSQQSVDEQAALQGELDRLRGEELPELQQQIVQLTEELRVTRNETSQLQAELEAAEQRSSDAEVAHRDEFTALVEQLTQSKAAASEFQASLETLDAERARLMQQVSELEGALSERAEACEQLQASLASADAGESSQLTELSTRIAELESQLQQQLELRQSLQAELQSLQSDQLDPHDDRLEELQRVLDTCQQEREALREELSQYQASAASQSTEQQQRQAALMEERGQLAARCATLEAECSQLQQERQADHEAALDREHDNQMAQSRFDQQMTQLQDEFEARQTSWQERESRLQQTIEQLQHQVDELRAASGTGVPLSDAVDLEAESCSLPTTEATGQNAASEFTEPEPAVPFEDQELQGGQAASFSEIPPEDAHTDGHEPDTDWLDQGAAFDESTDATMAGETAGADGETDSTHEPWPADGLGDDADFATTDGDPFSVALHAMEVSLHDLQNETTGEADPAWHEQQASADVSSVSLAAASDDQHASPTEPQHEPADNSSDAPGGDSIDEPLNEAESQLLARIRALTGEAASPGNLDQATDEAEDDVHEFVNEAQQDLSTASHSPESDTAGEDEPLSQDESEEQQEAATHELTIEDYMQRLLNRVGSAPVAGQAPAKTQTVVMGESELSSPHRIETKPKSSNPLSSSSNRERTARPLTWVEMEAMRELANESTRTALSSHAKRSQEKTALSTLSTAFILLLLSAILLILSRGNVSLFLLAGVLTLAAAVFFGYRAFRAGAASMLMASRQPKSAKKTASVADPADSAVELSGQEPSEDQGGPSTDAVLGEPGEVAPITRD